MVDENSQPIPAEQSTGQYYHYPGPQAPPPRGSNLGCWLTAFVTSFLVVGLIIIALFLPPFNLGERLFGVRYAMLDSLHNAAIERDLTFIVDPASPGTEFGVSLDSTDLDSFLDDTSDPARNAIQPYLALQSRVYTIETTGTPPETVNVTLALPPNSANSDVLDLYVWDTETRRWSFAPSQHTADNLVFAQLANTPDKVALFQALPTPPIIATILETGQRIAEPNKSLVNIVIPSGMLTALPTANIRTLTGNPAPGFELRAGYSVMPVVHNFTDPRATDPDTVVTLIGNRELRDEHIRELAGFATAGGYNGLFIDYRDIPDAYRDNFTGFISELKQNLNSNGLDLGVIVPPAENVNGLWQTGAYDWRAIGEVADYVQIEFDNAPQTFMPGPDHLVEAMLRWSVGEINRYKLLGGLSALSIREQNGDYSTVRFDEALSALGDVQLQVQEYSPGIIEPGSEIRIGLDGMNALPGVDSTIQSPFIDYIAPDNTPISRMWLTTGDALRFRMDRIAAFALAGVSFRDLLGRGVSGDVADAITNYKVQLPNLSSENDLVLRWRIEGAEGEITEFTTDLNEEIVVTLNAPDGNYAVNVDVVGGQISSARQGAAVAVFAPTATATPLPTSTPTATPTITPTLAPIVATLTPEPGQAPAIGSSSGPVAPPGSGSIAVGSFEYGGHVSNTASERAVNAMRNAGMTWMKVQIRWGVGGGVETAAQSIQEAHGNGFKILLGVVGDRDQLAAGNDEYVRQFAGFLGDVASLGPDAIEVWNEPNLGREWPSGRISGAAFAVMMREAYNAIKARNPSVMVISGAPAPTGAEAAFPGEVVNDDNFLRQMVDGGALAYMDCLGMHYNEGLVSPYATSGDPRGDNFYTRYLPSLLDVYWGITGGQRPICITELGYLTPEGYGPLDPFFGWAQNMTISQQSAYLAQAAAYASNSGRVRLMIVWNVDFQVYGADPMAGYAIIRADGSCPACSALAGAR